MSKNIITVEQDGENGMIVNLSGSGKERIAAIGATITAAVATMVDGGATEEEIREQINIYMDYAIRQGAKRAKARQTSTERVEIGYTVDKGRWHEAADAIEEVAKYVADYLLQRNLDGKGQEDKDEFLADTALVVTATRYVAEYATDKCRFIPVPAKKNRGDMT